MASTTFQRMYSVSRKELLHILRDGQTLFMTLLFPLMELILLGYAIDTNVRYIPTVVVDHCRTQETRALLQQFTSSGDFRIVGTARDAKEVSDWIIRGKARVGIIIPEHFSRRSTYGQSAQIQVLVDGTVSAIAGQAVGTATSLALRNSLEKALSRELAMDARPRVMFNPDLKSANFFVPGLMVVLCQIMAMTLSANAIVREKEKGTLEQLFMTPVRPAELILGKLFPYFVLTFVEFIGIAVLARVVFGVPMNGPFWVLLVIAVPFVLTMLAWGLWVSTNVDTRDAAMQVTMGSIVPCIFLSGYVFPLDSMPLPFWIIAQFLPTTWLIDAARGVILRGASWPELWLHAVVLWAMAIAILMYTSTIFRKRL